MPRIFDNIETQLLGVLVQTLHVSDRLIFVSAISTCAGGKNSTITSDTGPILEGAYEARPAACEQKIGEGKQCPLP